MIEALRSNIINETFRLLSKKKSIVLLIFSALVPIISLIILSFFQSGLGINPVGSADFPIKILGYFTGIFLPLFIVMAAVDSFSGEMGDRTIKITLLRPISRFKIYISKIIAIAVYLSVYLGIVFCVSTILGLFLEGKENLLQSIPENLLAYVVAIAPMLLLGISSALLSQFFKNASGAFLVAVLLFIVLKVAMVTIPGLSALTPISYNEWHLLWLSDSVSLGKLFSVFMFIFSYSIIFLASGYLLFERKEF